ncbi:MAG: PmoA family protein [Bryobacteraceae bacterium]
MLSQFGRCHLAVLLGCILSAATIGAPVELKQNKDHLEIFVGGKSFTTYYFGPDAAKAYLMPLQTANGIVISRPFPVGNDASMGDPKASSFEPHQRPLYFGHGDIDGLDFWAEAVFGKYYHEHSRQAFGHTANATIQEARGGPDSGTLRASFALEDPNRRVIGQETQEFTFRGDDHTRAIDCEFILKATNGPIAIGDSKEGTFGIRLGRELSAPLGHMINSHGGQGEKEIWGKPADWVDYFGTVSGRDVGIAVFDHPKSFRHPTTWHARAYGLLAANPFGFREFTRDSQQDGSWAIPEGNSLKFRYRVLIYEGSLSPDQISNAYKQYASEP